MDPRFSSAVFLILSCWFWNAECRNYNQILEVPNGGPWGEWGEIDMCSEGYANGFSLKFKSPRPYFEDDSAFTGIRLHCKDGTTQESTTEEVGNWGNVVKCSSGNLISFSLQMGAYREAGDDIAATNIKFACNDLEMLEGFPETNWNFYGPWSKTCKVGAICGMKTKVDPYSNSNLFDNTGLYDVQFFCCD